MRITTAQLFQIGSVLITLCAVLMGLIFDPQTTSVIAAAILTAWNAIGAILTSQGNQVQAVAARIDEPAVKQIMVPAVANLPGLQPVQTNAKADGTLKDLAASDAAANAKILQLPTGTKP